MSVIPTRTQIPQVARPGGGLAALQGFALSGSAGAGFSGRDFLRVVRKRKWLIIATTLICIVITAAITMVWLYTPLLGGPWYTARALLVVSPAAESELNPRGGEPADATIKRLAQSQVQMARTDSVLSRTLEDSEVRASAWLARHREDAVQELSDEIKVTAVAGTNLIAVEMTGTNKTELPGIVNALARAVVMINKQELRGERTDEQGRLSDTLNVINGQLKDIQEKMAAARSGEIPNMENQRNVLTVRVEFLSTRMNELELALAQSKLSLAILQTEQAEKKTLAQSTEIRQALDNDPGLRNLRNQETAYATELVSARQKFGRNHRKVQDLELRLKTVQEQMQQAEGALVEQYTAQLLGAREAQIAVIGLELGAVKKKFDAANEPLRTLQTNLANMQRFALQERTTTDRITRIENRLLELQLAARGNIGTVSMGRPASEPREPSVPRWAIFMPMGSVAGLLIAFGLAFLLEFIDTSIKGPADVSRRVDLPLLGMVPHTDDIEEEIRDVRVAFSEHPNSLVTEAFRQIRTCLQFSGPASQRRSLLVTSPLPEDGRGTVAMNLGASIARGGRSVLIVDANFRQPMIRNLFPACPQDGLSSALVGQAAWADLVHQVEPNLSVMSAGPLPPNPAELLGSDQMRQLIADMVGRYDQVIFDGAPCLVVTDSTILATVVDGVIMVIRAGVNTYGIVQRARDMLSRVGAHVIGVVLNGMRTTAGGYLKKNYDTFYEYHEQDAARLPAGAGQAPSQLPSGTSEA